MINIFADAYMPSVDSEGCRLVYLIRSKDAMYCSPENLKIIQSGLKKAPDECLSWKIVEVNL